MLKISHRVGHALTTAGKQSPDGIKEWAQAAPIAKLVIAELAHYEGIGQQRFDDPTGKVDKSTKQLCEEVNGWGSHVHIDYHLNAHGDGTKWTSGTGVEVFVNTRKPKKAVELATKVLNNIVSATGLRSRGVKYYNWDMVNFPKGDNILIEMGFMTNKNDVSVIRSKDGQLKIAAAIVSAIVAQYGLKRTKEAKQVTEKHYTSTQPIAKLGDKGDIVRLIHYFLAVTGHTRWANRENDAFTSTTENAVKSFQREQRIGYENGIVDYNTFVAFARVMAVYREHWVESHK